MQLLQNTTKNKLICFMPFFFSSIIYAGTFTDTATLRVVVRIPPKMTVNFEPVISTINQNSYSLCVNSSGIGAYRIHRPFDNNTSDLAVNYQQASGNYSSELVAGEYSHSLKSDTKLSSGCDHAERIQVNIRPPASKTADGIVRLIVAAE